MKRFGLLGEHLGHSFSPALHRALGSYDYGLYEIPPAALEDFLKTTALDGMNVTMPYKRAVVPFCAALSDAARRIGSVNTLVRRADGWYGDNTDAFGFAWLLRRAGCDPAGAHCAVLGSGGASLTVQTVLRALGAARVDVLSRSGRNDYAHLGDYAEAQIVVNATPVGMFPQEGAAAAPASAFPRCEAAIDLIYNPLRTDFLLQMLQMTFQGRKISCCDGLPMLVAQAARSAALFTGEAVADSKIEEILCKLKRDTENHTLIGMPGCGKTTVGRALAARLGRPFADTDEEIQARTGRSPAAWIRDFGEEAFRREETAALAALGRRTGIVLACGGGVVLRPENEKLLRQNGRIIWLQRELCKLSTADRPLSAHTEPAELYRQRAPLYARWADFTAENNGSAAGAAEYIKEKLE